MAVIGGLLFSFLETGEPFVPLIGNIMLILAGCFLLMQILQEVCGPVETFKLNNGRIRVCAYKNKTPHKHSLFELIIHQDKKSFLILAEEYAVPFKTPDAGCFIFREAKDNNKKWLVWTADTEETKVLGTRLNKILFISPEKEEGVNVLTKSGAVQQIKGDYFVYDDIYPPVGSRLCYAERNEKAKCPDKFLLVRQDGNYKIYGFYLSGEAQQCLEVIVSSIIFCEGTSRVLLRYDKDEKRYKELYRSRNDMSRRLNEYFIEASDDYNVSGKIYRYDGRRDRLNKIYEGDFRYVDFDKGQVLGGDGEIYGSDCKDNEVCIDLRTKLPLA